MLHILKIDWVWGKCISVCFIVRGLRRGRWVGKVVIREGGRGLFWEDWGKSSESATLDLNDACVEDVEYLFIRKGEIAEWVGPGLESFGLFWDTNGAWRSEGQEARLIRWVWEKTGIQRACGCRRGNDVVLIDGVDEGIVPVFCVEF